MILFCPGPANLIAETKAAHPRHNSENVVVYGVYAELLVEARSGDIRVNREEERGVVNARHVARARRLLFFRLEGKRVNVDARRVRNVGVVLVRLNEVEVRALAFGESVVTVEEELSGPDAVGGTRATIDVRVRESTVGKSRAEVVANTRGVVGNNGLNGPASSELGSGLTAPSTSGVTLRRVFRVKGVVSREAVVLVGRVRFAAIEETSVRETSNVRRVRGELRVRPDVDAGVVVVNNGAVEGALRRVVTPLVGTVVNDVLALDDPDEFLDGVVEVEARLVRRARERFFTRELELVDEVFVRYLGKTATFVRVEVDVVDVERSVLEVGVEHRRDRRLVRTTDNVALSSASEFNVDDDFVVLESNERESETRVAAEEELEGNVERRLGLFDRVRGNTRRDGGRRRTFVDFVRRERKRVANHALVTSLEARGEREFVEDFEPVTIVEVNTLTTDLEFNRVDEEVTERVDPAERSTRDRYRGDIDLEVDAVNEITVARNRAADALAEVGRAVESLLNSFHGKVSVASVDDLENASTP